jgi:hypothetical protein
MQADIGIVASSDSEVDEATSAAELQEILIQQLAFAKYVIFTP